MTRKGLKITLATVMCIFNLFVCFSGVLAWFTAAHRNNASGAQVQIYTHELGIQYKVYKYVEDEKAVINVTDYDDALTLQDYDSVFTERNENTPIIVEFVLSGMILEDNQPIDIISSLSNSQATHRLSDIIRLKFAVLNVQANTDEGIYTEVLDYLEDEDNNIPDLKFKNGQTRLSEITYPVSNYSSYVTNANLTVYLMLDYSIDLIQDLNLNEVSDISDLESINFVNDLSEINCVTHES